MATLAIGSSDSQCVECRRSASPSERGHYTNLGYNRAINGTPGCGEEWTDAFLTYYYPDEDIEEIIINSWLPLFIKKLLWEHHVGDKYDED